MARDFNCIDSSQEKQRDRAFVDGMEAREFRRFIEENRLMDLKFAGPHLVH